MQLIFSEMVFGKRGWNPKLPNRAEEQPKWGGHEGTGSKKRVTNDKGEEVGVDGLTAEQKRKRDADRQREWRERERRPFPLPLTEEEKVSLERTRRDNRARSRDTEKAKIPKAPHGQAPEGGRVLRSRGGGEDQASDGGSLLRSRGGGGDGPEKKGSQEDEKGEVKL